MEIHLHFPENFDVGCQCLVQDLNEELISGGREVTDLTHLAGA